MILRGREVPLAVPFVHLHVHSEYSLLDGAGKVEALVNKAADLGMVHLALTDHGVMYGTIPFYKACKKAGINPIIGCEIYVSNDLTDKRNNKEQKAPHLLLLVENEIGYKNLMKIVSYGHLEGFHYKPRVSKQRLREHHEGIIAFSACIGGEIPRAILSGNKEEARRLAVEYVDIFGKDNFYLELQDHGIEEQKRTNKFLIQLGKELDIPLVVTNDVHYIEQSDHHMHDCLLCIGTGTTIDATDRLRFPTSQFHMKSGEEMTSLFSYVPEAIDNTVKVAERCKVEISFDQSILPEFPLPETTTAKDFLRDQAYLGAKERYDFIDETHQERLDYELSVINQMGYDDYFLIVWDFMKFAHEQGIRTGPGRGSAAGSLVSYVLRITDIDPLKYNLIFERFLNPYRISMPDIDIDFSDQRRQEVIDYVTRKYGTDRVAQIVTFGTLAAKAAVRDVGRAMNMTYGDIDRAAKMIPGQVGMTIEKALVQNPDLALLCETNKKVGQMIEMAKSVEGLPRHVSTHAAGIVISREPLTEYVPLQRGSEDIHLTQYSMELLENIGLLKMDFLGLRNLTIIDEALRIIEETTGRIVRLDEIPFDDSKTFEMLSKGETDGVFQLESGGITAVVKEMKPSTFEDLIAILALYRPGPMENIPTYIEVKHGKRKTTYPHPDLEPFLKDTHGIIVYQEQIMQIASKMAGFTLGEADLLRRAIGKKKREILQEQREKFVAGAVNQGYDEMLANTVYDLIVKFADYGFPRSHAAAYAVIAYQTAYLKTHYPIAYMAALISEVMGSQTKVAEYIDTCKRMGIHILPPDVNYSGVSFTVEENKIRFGLGAIKNVGNLAIQSIIAERTKKPFIQLNDFCNRVDSRVCNKRVIESFIQAGAMESLNGHRAQLLASLDEIMHQNAKVNRGRNENQIHLFDNLPDQEQEEFTYYEVPPYNQRELLAFERELLGLYITGHPLDEYKDVIAHFTSHALRDGEYWNDGSEVIVAGRIMNIKAIITKKGQPMAFLEVEDMTHSVEVIVFPEVYRKLNPVITKEQIILLKAKVNQHDDGVKLIAETMRRIEEVPLPAKSTKQTKPAQLYIRVRKNQENHKLVQLKTLLLKSTGDAEIFLYYESTKQVIRLTDEYKVTFNEELKRHIEELLGPESCALKN